MADDLIPTYRIYRRWFFRQDRSTRSVLAVIREAYAARQADARPEAKPGWPTGRGGDHPHFCVSCSDGITQGPGCLNCRSTGFDQTPWAECQGCKP